MKTVARFIIATGPKRTCCNMVHSLHFKPAAGVKNGEFKGRMLTSVTDIMPWASATSMRWTRFSLSNPNSSQAILMNLCQNNTRKLQP